MNALSGLASGAAGAARGAADSAAAAASSAASSAQEKAHLVADSAAAVADAAKDGAGKAADVAGKAADVASGGAAIAKDGAAKAASAAKDGAASAAAAAAAAAKAQIREQKERLKRMKAQVIEMVEAWLKQKLFDILSKVVDKVPAIAKNALEDQEAPRCVNRGKDRVVDSIWPDLKEEIMWEVAVKLDGDVEVEVDASKARCCLLAFFRYHIFPNDKAIWGKLRDPFWIIFTLISLIPVAGICPLIFLFIFLIIDKRDEFQLIAFILQFKGTQFLSHGIIRTLVGFFQFINCVSAPATSNEHNCEKSGPGVGGPYEIIIGGYFLQVLLIWIAFFLLPWSEEKGRTQLKGKVDAQHGEVGNTSKKAGGYLWYFMIYDMFCFLLCMAVLGWAISTRPGRNGGKLGTRYDDWQVKHAMFGVQVIYGYLSLPFYFFTLPLLQAVLTHSVPTAYDSRGICCKCARPPKPKNEETKGKLLADAAKLDEGESDRIMSKFKTAIFGSSDSDDESESEPAQKI